MGLLTNIFITFVLVVIVAIATYFLTKGAADLVVKGDPNQQKAEEYLIAASTLGWISIAFIVIGSIGLAYTGGYALVGKTLAEEKVSKQSSLSLITYAFLGLIVLVFVINGALAVGAAVNIKKGPDFEENKSIYTQCAIIGGLFIGATGAVFLYMIYRWYADRKYEKEQEELAKINAYNQQALKNKPPPPPPPMKKTTTYTPSEFEMYSQLKKQGFSDDQIKAILSIL